IQCRSGDGSGRTARMSQSGLQYALGGATLEGDQSRLASDRVSDFSPCLILYFLVLVAGILAGFCMRWELRRCLAVAAAALVTLAILAGELAWNLTEMPQFFFPQKSPAVAANGAGSTHHVLFSAEVHFTFWFYLVCAFHSIAMLSAIAEWRYLRRPIVSRAGDKRNRQQLAA